MILAIEYGEPTGNVLSDEFQVGSSFQNPTYHHARTKEVRNIHSLCRFGRVVLAIRFARLGLHFSRSPLMVTSSPLPRVAVAGRSSTLPIVEATTAMVKGTKEESGAGLVVSR